MLQEFKQKIMCLCVDTQDIDLKKDLKEFLLWAHLHKGKKTGKMKLRYSEICI